MCDFRRASCSRSEHWSSPFPEDTSRMSVGHFLVHGGKSGSTLTSTLWSLELLYICISGVMNQLLNTLLWQHTRGSSRINLCIPDYCCDWHEHNTFFHFENTCVQHLRLYCNVVYEIHTSIALFLCSAKSTEGLLHINEWTDRLQHHWVFLFFQPCVSNSTQQHSYAWSPHLEQINKRNSDI